MKHANPKKIVMLMAITGVAIAGTGCGSAAPVGVGAMGIPGGVGYGVPGCVSITSPIGFTIPGASRDSITFYGGSIPAVSRIAPGRQAGTGNVMSGGQGGSYNTIAGSPDGSVSLNFMPTSMVVPGMPPTTTGMTSQTGTITGVAMVSPAKQELVKSTFLSNQLNPGAYPFVGSMPGYNPTGIGIGYSQPILCAYAVAIAMSYGISLDNNPTTLNAGDFFLYLLVNGAGQQYMGANTATGRGTILRF